MKIQVAQTLPNGQVTQQVLSREGGDSLKIQVQPGAKISFNVEGVKPADAANAKAKTGSIKKTGNNLVLESEGEALVEVTDFYSTAGVSVGDVGWNYAAVDAGVMAVTPEAQALSSDAAMSESGALFPAIAPGWLVAGGAATVAAVASGGSSSAATVAGNIVSGVIVAGPVVAGHGLSVVLYKSDGTALLGTARVDNSGKFSLDVGSYTGVIIAKVVDAGVGADYADEASGLSVDMVSQLMAVGVVTGGALKLNINPLTSIAAQKAGLQADGAVPVGAAIDATLATEANAAVAKAFGLTDITQTDPDTSNDSVAGTNTIGAVLAALSGLDALNGNAQTTIDNFVAGITKAGAVGVLTTPAQTAVLQGAAIADPAGTLGLVNKISDSMSNSVGATGFSVGDVATGNIIRTADALTTTTTITGTVATGTLLADLDLKIGGVASANNAGFALVGTTWTYTLSAADVTALTTGADGVLAIELTVAGVTKGQRMILKEMTDDAPSAVTFLNPLASISESSDNTSGTKLADINIADIDGYDGVTPTVGNDANFEVRTVNGKYELWLKSGVSIDYETVVGQALSTTVTAGGTVSQEFKLDIANANEAPTVANPIADQIFVVGGAVDSFQIPLNAFADVDAGTTLTYAATLADGTALPSWLSWNASTRTFSGNPTVNGTVNVKVTASDGAMSISDEFVITSVTAPVVQSFTVTDGAIGNGDKLGKSGEALTFVVTLSEAVTSTAGLTAVFTVNGEEVTATSAAVTGSNTITFTGGSVPATGDGTAIGLKSLSATSGSITGNVSGQPMVVPTEGAITHAGYTVDNAGPAISTISLSAAENGITVGSVVGTDASAITWSLDGGGADDSKFSITSAGVLSLAASQDFETPGSAAISNAYTVKLKATDEAGNVSTKDITVNVTNVNEAPTVASPIADQIFVVGGAVDSFQIPLNAFADVDAGTTLTYAATLADGTALPSWLSWNASTRTFSGNPTVNGTVNVKVTASDGAMSISDEFVITSVTAPVVQSFTVTDGAIDNGDKLGKSGEALTFVVTLSEAVTSTAGLTAVFTVNGEEVTATSAAVTGSNTITFTGGSVPVTGDGTAIGLKSLSATSGSITGNVSGQPMVVPTEGAITHAGYTVDNTGPAISTISLSAAENGITVGSVVGTDASAITWSLDGGGADDSKFSITSAGVLSLAASQDFETPGSAAISNAYTVKLKATDEAGNVSTKDITVNVTDVNEAPTVTSTAIPDVTVVTGSAYTIDSPLFLDGTSVNVSSYFTDPDINSNFNTLTYSLGEGAPSWLQIDSASGTLYGIASNTAEADLPVTVKAFDGLNTVEKSFKIDLVSLPALKTTQNLDNVTNLDVKSALVLDFTENLALGSGQIRIFDDMGTSGYTVRNATAGVVNNSKQDVTDNDVLITLTNGVVTGLTVGAVSYTEFGGVGWSTQRLADSVKVSGSKLIIDLGGSEATTWGTNNTSWNFDWDFGANYHVELGAGVVKAGASGPANLAMTDATRLNFTTVTPADGAAGAASQKMDSADASLISGVTYHNAHQGSTASGQAGAIDMDFGMGAHALVYQLGLVNTSNTQYIKTSVGGNVDIANFGADDVIYGDNMGVMTLKTLEGLTGAVWSGSGNATTGAAGTSTLKRTADTDTSGLASWVWFSDATYTVASAWGDSNNLNGFEQRLQSNVVISG